MYNFILSIISVFQFLPQYSYNNDFNERLMEYFAPRVSCTTADYCLYTTSIKSTDIYDCTFIVGFGR